MKLSCASSSSSEKSIVVCGSLILLDGRFLVAMVVDVGRFSGSVPISGDGDRGLTTALVGFRFRSLTAEVC